MLLPCLGLALAAFPAAAVVSAAPAKASDALAFGAIAQASVTGLRIENLSDVVELSREGDLWRLPRFRMDVRGDRLKQALDALFALRTSDPVPAPEQSTDLSAYGLSPEYAWTVDVLVGKKSKRLLFGKSPTDFKAYWKWSDKAQIYRAGTFGWNLPADPGYWADRSLGAIDPWRVREVEVHWIDSAGSPGGYHLVKVKADSAVLIAGDTLTLRWSKALSVFLQTREFAFDDFAELADTAKAAKLPQVSVRVVDIGDTARSFQTTGLIGRYYLVKHPGGTRVRVLKDRFDAFRRQVSELTAPLVLGPEPDDGWGNNVPPPGFGVRRPHGDRHDEDQEDRDESHKE